MIGGAAMMVTLLPLMLKNAKDAMKREKKRKPRRPHKKSTK